MFLFNSKPRILVFVFDLCCYAAFSEAAPKSGKMINAVAPMVQPPASDLSSQGQAQGQVQGMSDMEQIAERSRQIEAVIKQHDQLFKNLPQLVTVFGQWGVSAV